MEKQNLIITIGRQYGSGGAEVGKKLGQRMGLDVYDKEILKMTSDESGKAIFIWPTSGRGRSCFIRSSSP